MGWVGVTRPRQPSRLGTMSRRYSDQGRRLTLMPQHLPEDRPTLTHGSNGELRVGLLRLDQPSDWSQSGGMTSLQIDWPFLLKIVTAAMPVAIAAIVAWVAIQQWLTARDKLALELFDRRFEAWKALDAAFDGHLAHLFENYEVGGLDPTPGFDSMNFVRAESYTRFLFGEDFREKLGELTTHLFHLREGPRDGSMYIPMRRHAVRLRWELEDIAERYMMLKRIAVARPREPLTDRFMKFTRPPKAPDEG